MTTGKGIDFPNVKVVCTTGLPSTIVDALQRGGRAIRIVSFDPALFVVFYDPWALEISSFRESEHVADAEVDGSANAKSIS